MGEQLKALEQKIMEMVYAGPDQGRSGLEQEAVLRCVEEFKTARTQSRIPRCRFWMDTE